MTTKISDFPIAFGCIFLLLGFFFSWIEKRTSFLDKLEKQLLKKHDWDSRTTEKWFNRIIFALLFVLTGLIVFIINIYTGIDLWEM